MAEEAPRTKITVNVDKALKDEFEAMCEASMMTMNQAIVQFIVQTVRSGEFSYRIPTKSHYRYAVVELPPEE